MVSYFFIEVKRRRRTLAASSGVSRIKIEDPGVVGVLKHILDEEKRHRKEFRIRLEEI